MNSDTLAGGGKDLGGSLKEGAGKATGNESLRGEGVADQLTGQVQKGYGVARDNVGPLAEKAKQFARDRPYTAAALAGVVGLAILNTLRGR
ncbi:CsbD family protein [Sphingomonas sp.]|uniref:CsbD family protein n=1 Tax=Sphingomonas sp. TaxID=28214 RepID=UPI0035BC039E